MRENYRNSIASVDKFSQFTIMNAIDGQAGLIICASLIFYSLTIDNILNIIVLLILAGISIQMLTGDNGILTRAGEAKEATGTAQITEELQLAINGVAVDYHTGNNSGSFRDYIFSTDAGKGQEKLKAELGASNLSFDAANNKITYKGIVFDVLEDGTIKESIPIAITGISINQTNPTVDVGETTTLTVTLTPSGANESVKWTSENTEVATVNETTGVVTGVEVGTAVIKASNPAGNITQSVTVTVETTERVLGIDDYINYNVTYTDMCTNYEFKAGNGWRLLTQLTEEQKAAGTYTGDIKIISTGVPARLYYYYNVNTGKDNNGWWGTADDVREVFAEWANIDTIANAGYDYNNNGYPNYFAAAGLQKNFRLIKFKRADTNSGNYGYFKKINGNNTANAEVYGSVFNTGEYTGMSVHNLSLEELNVARGQTDATSTTSTNGADAAKGLFYLRNLGGHGYSTSISPYYWLASPDASDRLSVRFVSNNGDINSYSYYYTFAFGVRPVVSIPNVTITKNGQVWTIN